MLNAARFCGLSSVSVDSVHINLSPSAFLRATPEPPVGRSSQMLRDVEAET